jgi:hypothetical protein
MDTAGHGSRPRAFALRLHAPGERGRQSCPLAPGGASFRAAASLGRAVGQPLGRPAEPHRAAWHMLSACPILGAPHPQHVPGRYGLGLGSTASARAQVFQRLDEDEGLGPAEPPADDWPAGSGSDAASDDDGGGGDEAFKPVRPLRPLQAAAVGADEAGGRPAGLRCGVRRAAAMQPLCAPFPAAPLPAGLGPGAQSWGARRQAAVCSSSAQLDGPDVPARAGGRHAHVRQDARAAAHRVWLPGEEAAAQAGPPRLWAAPACAPCPTMPYHGWSLLASVSDHGLAASPVPVLTSPQSHLVWRRLLQASRNIASRRVEPSRRVRRGPQTAAHEPSRVWERARSRPAACVHSHAPVMHGTGQPAHGVSVAQGGREWAEARCAGALGALGAAEVPPAGAGGPAGCPLAAAAAALAPAAAPRSMPCRDAERAALAAFLEEAVAAGAAPGCRSARAGQG